MIVCCKHRCELHRFLHGESSEISPHPTWLTYTEVCVDLYMQKHIMHNKGADVFIIIKCIHYIKYLPFQHIIY
jgi:hypothetical protein